MERLHKSDAVNTRSGVNKDAAGKVDGTSCPSDLPHIAKLIKDAQITIGVVRPVGRCVAIANDRENTLAMLARRNGETRTSSSPASTWLSPGPTTTRSIRNPQTALSTAVETFSQDIIPGLLRESQKPLDRSQSTHERHLRCFSVEWDANWKPRAVNQLLDCAYKCDRIVDQPGTAVAWTEM